MPYIRSESFEPNRMGEDFVDTTLAPQPTSNVVFVSDTTSAQGASETPSSPLDVTMLAMLGLTMAGAGVMKSQSAQKKQQELAQEKVVAQAQLATAKADQAQISTANWEQNQTMQASAKQAVVTQVTQSQANIEFMDGINRWYQQSIIAKISRQLQQAVTLTGIRDTVNQAWGRYGSTQDVQLGILFEYWMQTYGNITGMLDETHIQDTNPFKANMENAFGYNIQWGNALAENMVGQWKSLANLLASNLHIASYFNENMSRSDEPGLDVFRKYFAQIPDGTPVTIHLGEGNANQGFVPLPNEGSIESDIYLGAEVNIATITHEFGHQFDRWFEMSGLEEFKEGNRNPGGITGYLTQSVDGVSRFFAITNRLNLNSDVYLNALNGFAGKQLYPQEVWADIFMTAILTPNFTTEPPHTFDYFTVYSFDFFAPNIKDIRAIISGGDWTNPEGIIVCGQDGVPCIDKVVQWRDTNSAKAIIESLWRNSGTTSPQQDIFNTLFTFGNMI